MCKDLKAESGLNEILTQPAMHLIWIGLDLGHIKNWNICWSKIDWHDLHNILSGRLLPQGSTSKVRDATEQWNTQWGNWQKNVTISWLTYWLTQYVSYQLWTCLSLWESDRRYFTIMLHIASSDQKQMAALTGSPPRVNSQKLKFAQAEAPLRFSSFKTCHFFAT